MDKEKIKALEKELILEVDSYNRADFALRKGFDFRINAIKEKLKSLNLNNTNNQNG